MEDVLDLYAEPYDGRRPQVCFDESPVPLISETRQPVPARPGQPTRYDYAYRREGTAYNHVCGLNIDRQVCVKLKGGGNREEKYSAPLSLMVLVDDHRNFDRCSSMG